MHFFPGKNSEDALTNTDKPVIIYDSTLLYLLYTILSK